MRILRNQGNATFEPEVRYAAAGEPRCLALADIDGDEDADLAVATFMFDSGGAGNVSVLLNQTIR